MSPNEAQPKALDQYETEYKKRLLETPNSRVTEFRVSPGQESPWHYHTSISDLFYVLDGCLQLSLEQPAETFELSAGQCYQIAVGRPHRFRATGSAITHYLLIQGVGKFDFVTMRQD